ncbi:hypothetical protein DRQ23_08150 [bacterium]|nr:MAG: hypothetical protein DRQ23_08150 [bacterium]
MNRILLVEDINNFRDMLKRHLEKAGFKVVDFPDAESVLKQEDLSFDAGVFDLKLRRLDGIGLIKKLRERGIYFPVIIITAYGDVETAVKAIRSGAYDFIQKPFDPEVLINRLTRMLHEWKGVSEEIGLDSIIGDSSGVRRAKELAGNVAMSDTNVLLIGESGTGKELFARLIHVLSNRRSKPFVVVNSTAIPETLFESELFGIEKGTATGVEGRIGKLEIANGGTVFFDEIGDMPVDVQSKLLRVIEDRTVFRVGSRKGIKLDIRFIFATNRDLRKEVEKGNFREDLFYRVAVFPIELPPLRERKEDIPLLVEYFIDLYSHRIKKPVKGIEEKAMDLLLEYNWPGNVRELENVIERAIILCKGKMITPEDIMIYTPEKEEGYGDLPMNLKEAGEIALKKAEVSVIKRALRESNGNKKKAAKLLGISYKTLYNKMKQYGID